MPVIWLSARSCEEMLPDRGFPVIGNGAGGKKIVCLENAKPDTAFW